MSSCTLTWDPSETGITEIKSYTIFRNVDGGAYAQLIVCPVRRDFLGGIISIDNCTLATVPEHPKDPWTNVIEDCPITYVDATVTEGHTYCYYVTAQPLGNNQSTAQGSDSAPSNIQCIPVVGTATTPVLTATFISAGEIDVSWTAATVVGSTIANYRLYRNVDGGVFSLLTTIAGLAYPDMAVSVGHTYCYYVVAHPVLGNDSANSNTQCVPIAAAGKIVAVGHGVGTDFSATFPTIYTRSSGGVWAQQTAPGDPALGLIAVAHNASLWLALTNFSDGFPKVDTSADGITWAQEACPWSLSRMRCAAYGGTTWVVAGDAQSAMYSTDGGLTWTLTGVVFDASFIAARRGLAYGNGVFVVSGSSATTNNLYYSSNGIAWTASSYARNLGFAVIFDGTRFVALGKNTTNQWIVATSLDGNTWNEVANIGALVSDPIGLAYNGTKYCLTGSGSGKVLTAATAAGLAAGTVTTLDAVNGLGQITALGNTFVALSNDGTTAYSSTDGVGWTTEATGATPRLLNDLTS